MLVLSLIGTKALSQDKKSTHTTKDSTNKKQVDTLKIPESNSALQAEVKYTATDSIVYDVSDKKVYLYSNAKINYQEIQLEADYVIINWATNEIYAEGRKDSSGKIKGLPVFTEKGTPYKANKLSYNFKSKKGKVIELHTAQGEGFIIVPKGKYFKEDSGQNIIYAKDAKYTTCSLDEPHFYIQANKLKLIPKDKVITGTAVMHIADVPMPLLLPFGFFPAQSRRSSGIIIPAYGEDVNRGGFFLRGGGYYFGLNDHYDLKLTGDIYANGGLGLQAATNYNVRYKMRGSIALSYSNLIIGLEDVLAPDSRAQYRTQQYNVQWSHSEDSRAHPGSSFSANVNAGSSKYLSNNSFDYAAKHTGTMQSSISYSKTFTGTPFSINSSVLHSQNTQTKAVNISLPQVDVTMNRIYPFAKINYGSSQAWYKRLGITWNANFKNEISEKEDRFFYNSKFNDSIIGRMKNGIQHSLPISTSISVLKYFNFSPSFNYRGMIYFKREIQNWNPQTKSIEYTPQYGFFYANDYSTSASLNTKVYGTFPINKFGLIAMRHTLSPNMSFRFTPDFSDASYHYYNTVQTDSLGSSKKYSYFERSIYGTPGQGKFGGLDFSLGNIFELKAKSKTDTVTHTKKIQLLDNLSIFGSYNFLKDSLRLSPISISANTRLFNIFNINSGCTINPYLFNAKGQDINQFRFAKDYSLGRVTSANLSMSASFNPSANKKQNEVARTTDPRVAYYYPGTYVDYDIPWNLSLNYILGYYPAFSTTEQKFAGKLTQTLSLSGGLQFTPNWKVNFVGGYDFLNKQLTPPQINIYRDLHCWEMRFEFAPIGAYKHYMFTIQIKAPTLRDLKYDKKYDGRTYR